MNVTAVCDTTPNQLLFGGKGCCVSGDEPFELAEWTGKLCNGSEWREPFDICGGMACLDWREWIMPWNWTVRNESLPPEQHQTCTSPSKYLAIYGGEHFFWLFFALTFGGVRLRIAQHEEKHDRDVLRYFFLSIWTGLTKKFRQKDMSEKEVRVTEGEQYRPPFTEKLRWGFPVCAGIFLAGAQLGFNLFAAHLVKEQPGYHDVPLGMLALLFCCRPRLTWLSCLLAQIPDTWLIKIFGFVENGDGVWAARMILSSVAVTSAVTEAIMQLLGGYFLGRAAQVGRERGFYYVHHLRPKFRGRDARHMYLGGLFWVMLCIPMVIALFILAFFFGQVFNGVLSFRRGLYDFFHTKTPNMPELAQGKVEWLLDYINPDPLPPKDDPPPTPNPFDDQPVQLDSDQPILVDRQSFYDQPLPYGGPGTGDLFSDQPMPVRHGSSRRSRYSRLSQSEFEDQIMPVPRAASGSYRYPSGGYAHAATGVQRRTPSGNQYNTLPQHDAPDEEGDQILPHPPSQQHPRRQPEMREISRGESHHSLLAPELQVDPPSSSAGSSSRKRSDYDGKPTWGLAEWESTVIWTGAMLGFFAYASQWLFWDGFVKAAGDRFCPPGLGKVAGVWVTGAFLCKCRMLR